MEKKTESEKQKESNSLILIPKIENYIEYILNIIVKLPRAEKFSIGNEYKTSMYRMLEETMLLNKISIKPRKDKRKDIVQRNSKEYLELINKIDVYLNCQRIYLRIMNKNHWIDQKRFSYIMEKIYEIGKIIGGLYKYYDKNN